MKSLFLKIFLAYWIVVIGVNTLSDAVVHDQLRRPPFTRAAMRSALKVYASQEIPRYETFGCSKSSVLKDQPGDAFYLADLKGRPLCGNLNAPGLETLASNLVGNTAVLARRLPAFQVVGTSVKSESGKQYIAYLVSTYPSPTATSTWLWLAPGWTTFISSCVVILVFTILLVIPIRRLRKAAEQIAGGNLQARVAVKRPSIFSPKDEMRVLMLDFNRMAARLESLVSSHRMLLRDVSHELRSPLARLGLASALARQATSQGAHPHLDRIDQESARLNNLIGQLLSLSAMEDNRDISIAPCLSLADLLRQMLPDVEYEASVRGCTVVTTIQGECVVKADPDLMHSALENILRNAIRYSPERGRIQVELSTEELQGGTFAAVQVSDNGPGVPPEDLEAILQPFYRVDKSRGSGTGGFGVGLAIANRAVRLYGGNIDIQNRMGGGLCVRVVLPLDPESLELRVLQVA